MKRGLIWIILTCLIVTSVIWHHARRPTQQPDVFCAGCHDNSKRHLHRHNLTTNQPRPHSATGNWWDKLGTPSTWRNLIRTTSNIRILTRIRFTAGQHYGGWMETLFELIDIRPAVFDYK